MHLLTIESRTFILRTEQTNVCTILNLPDAVEVCNVCCTYLPFKVVRGTINKKESQPDVDQKFAE